MRPKREPDEPEWIRKEAGCWTRWGCVLQASVLRALGIRRKASLGRAARLRCGDLLLYTGIPKGIRSHAERSLMVATLNAVHLRDSVPVQSRALTFPAGEIIENFPLGPSRCRLGRRDCTRLNAHRAIRRAPSPLGGKL